MLENVFNHHGDNRDVYYHEEKSNHQDGGKWTNQNIEPCGEYSLIYPAEHYPCYGMANLRHLSVDLDITKIYIFLGYVYTAGQSLRRVVFPVYVPMISRYIDMRTRSHFTS
jgi:hypothetical protein